MRASERLVSSVAAMGACLVLAGCGSSGSNAAQSGNQAIFDPCDLTAQQLSVVGDQLTDSNFNDIGEQDDESRGCSWNGAWYGLTIGSFAHSFEETQRNTAFAQMTPIEIPGRAQAARYTTPSETFDQSCGVVIALPHGVITVDVSNHEAGVTAHDTCGKAVEITEGLDRYFPR